MVISFFGSLDAGTLRAMEPKLLEVVEPAGVRVVIDLHRVTGMDSRGLGMLLAATKRARLHGGDVVIAGVPPCLEVMFRVTGVGRFVRVVSDEQEALSVFEV